MSETTEDNEIIETLFQHINGFIISKVLFTACELGVFDLLLESGEALSSATIAERLGINPTGAERLLEICACLKLLRMERKGINPTGAERLLEICVCLKVLRMERKDSEGLYGNANIASLYLAKSSPKSQYHLMKLFTEFVYSSFQYFTDAVREGKNQRARIYGPSQDNFYEAISRSQEEVQEFLYTMDDTWRIYGQEVMSAFDLSHFPIICDLGGGSGALAKHCISLYPNTTVTVFDLPEVVEIAKKNPGSSEEGRITFQGGDFLKDPIPEADLYILARVLHNWDDERCLLLLRKLYKACKPGGGVLIIGSFIDEDRNGPLRAHIYSAIMLLCFDGKGRSFSEHKALLGEAGFKEMQLKKGRFLHTILARK